MPRDIIFELRKIRNKQKILEDGGENHAGKKIVK